MSLVLGDLKWKCWKNKMKTVFDTQEVAHIWNSGSQDYGKNKRRKALLSE